MKRSTRGCLVAAVSAATLVAGALPATADDKPVVTVEKGTSFDLDVGKGEACAFAVRLHGEADIKTITRKRTTTTIYSHAFLRVTNPANNRSVRLNANTTFVDRELGDGSLASTSRGNAVLWGTHLGFSADAGPAMVHIRGKASWVTLDAADADSPSIFSRIQGTVTNVCDLVD